MGQIIFEGAFLILNIFEFTRYFFGFHTILKISREKAVEAQE